MAAPTLTNAGGDGHHHRRLDHERQLQRQQQASTTSSPTSPSSSPATWSRRQGRHHPGRRLLRHPQPAHHRHAACRPASASSFPTRPTAPRCCPCRMRAWPASRATRCSPWCSSSTRLRDQDGVTGTYGTLPSPIAVLTLDQDPATGKLEPGEVPQRRHLRASHGLWITCGASLSPWGTHLSSEEYEPDAFTAASDAQFKAFSKNLYGSETDGQPVQLRPPARSHGQPGRHRHRSRSTTAWAASRTSWCR